MSKVEKETMAQDASEGTSETPKSRKRKVLKKDLTKYPGKLVMEVLDTDVGELVFDPTELPKEIQERLPAFALNHRLGDAAAGKAGQEAIDSIKKVWDGMMANNWSVRAPATKKIAVNDIVANLSKLPDAEQNAAKTALAAIGISL